MLGGRLCGFGHTVPDIYVIGLGLVGTHQITGEGWHALRSAKSVFVLHFDPLVVRSLEREVGPVDTLDDLYELGLDRRVTYRRMADRVVQVAVEGGPVCLALYGHPLVFVTPTSLIVEEGRRRGLKVKVQPGISALDCILVDLNVDPASEGLQQYEATDMLLRERPLQPDVPSVIWQIGTVGLATFRGFGSIPAEGYAELVAYLLRFYPSTHEVAVVRTATSPLGRSRILRTTVGNISSLASDITSADTMFIPAVERRAITNTRLSEQMAIGVESERASSTRS